MKTYWKFQLLGWATYAAIMIASATLFGAQTSDAIGQSLLAAGLGIAVTHAERGMIHRFGWKEMSLVATVPRVLLASLVAGAVITFVFAAYTAHQVPPGSRAGFIGAFWFGQTLNIVLWNLLYFGYHGVLRFRTAESERLRAEISARETELTALKDQLNPHFLFNSLNSLRGLIEVDPDRARDAVTALAVLLRRTLQLSGKLTVDLASEVTAVQHYLGLESIRLEERLTFSIDVAPEALRCQVPPMLVQTLVENAVKHGISQRRQGGWVEVKGLCRNDRLHLTVSNSGRLEPNSAGDGGIGLRNSKERIRQIYGSQAGLHLYQSTPETITAEVVLPRFFEQPEAASIARGRSPASGDAADVNEVFSSTVGAG